MKERSTLIVSVALLGALAAGSYWLAERARQSDGAEKLTRHDPDYYVDRFLLTRMDEQGQGRYTISAAKMLHFPDDDTAELSEPRLVSLASDRPKVNMRADRGKITSDAVEVHLSGNVELNRAAAGASEALRMRTSYLLVYPERDFARTDQNVEMVQGGSRVTGRGLEFDNGKREAVLNPNNTPGTRVKAVLAPKTRGAGR